VIQTLAYRAGRSQWQFGTASADARGVFELVATRGSEVSGICSNPFLEAAFKTVEFRHQGKNQC